jgi:hypothetical protein
MSPITAEKEVASAAPLRATVKVIRPNGRIVYDYDLLSIVESETGRRQIASLERQEQQAAAPAATNG